MNYKDYKRIITGESYSIGMFGENIYAFEFLDGIANLPIYVQLTKAEFDNFDIKTPNTSDFQKRKILCSASKSQEDINTENVLTDKEIELKKKNKSLWKSGVYSKEYYDGTGVVVIDYVPYRLTKRAYEDTPLDTSLLSRFESIKLGYLWQLVYEEVKKELHLKGTYGNILECFHCGNKFYFNDANIPRSEKYETRCPNCNSFYFNSKL